MSRGQSESALTGQSAEGEREGQPSRGSGPKGSSPVMRSRAREETVRGGLDGLWLVLVDGKNEQRVPMMARAGDEQTYPLGFKNAHKARKFLETSPVPGAEPRMVVRSNKDELLRVAKANGVGGVLG